jgi:hypothetical protein
VGDPDISRQPCPRRHVVHDEHRWSAGRLWKRERMCPGVQPAPEPWQAKAYRKADDLLGKVWDLHGTPVTHDRPGFGGVGRTFWCSHCRMPWPCETARLVINWGEVIKRDYEPRVTETGGEWIPLRIDTQQRCQSLVDRWVADGLAPRFVALGSRSVPEWDVQPVASS